MFHRRRAAPTWESVAPLPRLCGLRPFLLRLALLLSLAIADPFSTYAQSYAQSYAPGVRELNAHVIASFDHSEFDIDQPTEFRNERGSVTGVVSIPIDRELASRIFVTPFYHSTGGSGSTAADQVGSLAVDTGGVSVGGDLFLRYPSTFEVSIGGRYAFSDIDGESAHALGGEAIGKVFLDGFGAGPVDIKASTFFTGTDLADNKATRGREYGGAGSTTLYFNDQFSVEAQGFWRRLNQSEGRDQDRSGGGVEFDYLIPVGAPVTLSLRASGGRLQTKRDNSRQDEPYYSAGVSVTISFPGADSLVELERNLY